ncbi:MAG: DUF4340 domain-containing protein [bacterium]
MSRNWIWGLGISILVMLSIVVFDSKPVTEQDTRLGEFMLQGLRDDLAGVHKMVFKNSEMITTLESRDGNWVVLERFGFDADFGKLAGLLKAITGSRLTERKTSKPKNFSILGVASNDPDAVEIEIFSKQSSYTVLVGNSVSNRTGQYIRLLKHETEANQVWLIDTELESSADPAYWLDDAVIDVEAERVQRVMFSQGEVVLVAERKDGELELQGLAEGAELRYPTIVNTLARALVNVRLIDLVPAGQVDFSSASKAQFSLDDESEINLVVVETQGSYWLNLLDHAHSEWAFEVDSLVFENLTKQPEDLLKQAD